MHLDPPFDRLDPRAAEGAGPARAVAVTLPGDLAAWLEARCESDAERSNLVATALDAARRFDAVGRWPDPPPKPAPPRFETFEEFQAFLDQVRKDMGIEPGDLDDWQREREAERARRAAQNEAVDRAEATAGRRAAA